jgi:hypothetical protein
MNKSKNAKKSDGVARAAWSPEPFKIGDGVDAQIERDGDDAIILTDGKSTIILGREAWECLVEFVELTDLAIAIDSVRK